MGSKKLSDKQIKKIIAERAEGASYNGLAKRYKVSANTIKKYCMDNPEFAQICDQKNKENTESILSHMETKVEEVCGLIDALIMELSDPERIKNSSTKEIATAFGIIVDKFDKMHDKTNGKADTSITVTFTDEVDKYAN